MRYYQAGEALMVVERARGAATIWLAACLLVGCQASERKDARGPEASAEAKAAGAASLAVPQPPADVRTTSNGVSYQVTAEGSGREHPNPWDVVKLRYRAWDGQGQLLVDNTAATAAPIALRPAALGPGFSEGLAAMVAGERRTLWVPEGLAKGPATQTSTPRVYDVLLLEFSRTPGPPPAPADVQGPPADAELTPSGLASKLLSPGTGKQKPGATDVVRVHFTGWTSDGKVFGSSIPSGQPSFFALDKAPIKGWSEGLTLMVEGEKRRLWIPEPLAYGGRAGKPPGTLVLDVELLEIVTPRAPADLRAPPKDAEQNASGVRSKVLRRGTGARRPGPADSVRVHFSGWGSDGKLFASSLTDGQAADFDLAQASPGWSEILQMMVEGERRRVWVPAGLNVSDESRVPPGALVFEIELLDIAGE